MSTQVTATNKSVRMSPRKVGLVASLVRGRTVSDALTILDHTPKRAALPVAKVIASAKANAENNHNLKADSLTIHKLTVTSAGAMKRFRPAAHGRALPYLKRSSRIHVVLEGDEIVKKKPAKKTEDKAVDKKPAKEQK